MNKESSPTPNPEDIKRASSCSQKDCASLPEQVCHLQESKSGREQMCAVVLNDGNNCLHPIYL